ncbi:MAG: type II secretion system F family protein [Magnetospirillum sp.]|nr:type II secretion system F family protein [Magnetospirillum sp.]
MSDIPSELLVIVLVLLVAVALFGWTIYTVLYGQRARLQRRLAVVMGEPEAKSKAGRPGAARKRKAIQSRLKQVDQSRTDKRSSPLRDQLMQAGFRIEVSHFVMACVVLAVAAGGLYALSPMPRLGIPLVGAIVGFGVPKFVVGFLAKRRLKAFTALFADAIDVIVRGIRSGLPLGECIKIIGREMPEPLGAEFRLLAEGQKLGLTLADALERAVDRMPTPELKYFAIVLNIQQQTGGNLAETLAKLSDVLRSRKRMRDKIQAYASEARASAMIIGSLPIVVTILLAVVAPEYIGLLFTTSTGHILVAIGLSVMGTGVMVMRGMINFDI